MSQRVRDNPLSKDNPRDMTSSSNIKNRVLSLEMELDEKKKVLKLLEVKRKGLEETIKKLNSQSNEVNKEKIMVSFLLTLYFYFFL